MANKDFEIEILRAIQAQGADAYSITIKDDILARTGRNPSIGAIYRVCDELEARGWISSRLVDRQVEGRPSQKRIYALLARGKEAIPK